MSRVKTFFVETAVTDEVLAECPDVRGYVSETLRAAAAKPQRGPRGGRYLPVGEPYHFVDGMKGDDFLRARHTFGCRVDAKYVRPDR